uniref:Uncharacterized protein n=1 Tax=viral metagenome TaxID=1070528 RepID=A0A6M3JJS4_9ZZZZ
MKVKVTATVVFDTDTVEDKHHKRALEKLAWNTGDNLDKIWAWDEAADRVDSHNITVELL